MPIGDKKREGRVRCLARREGFRLIKSRARNWNKPCYGRFMLVESMTNLARVGAGRFAFDATIDEAEAYLSDRVHR